MYLNYLLDEEYLNLTRGYELIMNHRLESGTCYV